MSKRILTILLFLSCLTAMATDDRGSLNQLLSRCESLYTSESVEYAECLLWCAHVCAEEGDNIQANNILKKSRDMFSMYGNGMFDGRDSLSYIFSLDLEARIKYDSGQDFSAIRLLQKSSILKKTYFGDDSEQYFNSLLDISQLYSERMNIIKSNYYHNLGYKAYVKQINEEFCATSEYQRSQYWDIASRYINRTLKIAHKTRRSSRGRSNSLASAAYNAVLLSKGLLLNTTLGFENHIQTSNNEDALTLLVEKKKKIELNAEQKVIDSLDYAILDILERSGQRFSLPHLSMDWKDVTSALSPHDLAIEFYKTVDGNYGAILLKKNWKSPKIVRLNEYVKVDGGYHTIGDALKKITLDEYTPEMCDALWNLSRTIWPDKIIKYFPSKDKGRVYFSAEGELLITGIEYMPAFKPGKDGSFYCLSDLFSLYRLSSTRELVHDRKPNDNINASIYGGLQYDMSYDELVADSRMIKDDVKEIVDTVIGRKRSSRGSSGIEYLRGTDREIDSIYLSISNSDSLCLNAKKYVGKEGTEASFKALSNTGQRLIHIASHGYFYQADDKSFLQYGLGNHSMSRSGLYFAGAENKYFGDEMPDGVDDGFLTALEISNLDFRDLELVVLSACETARGDVESDGVFGLQRGFKMASANSILMSLWKVDDEATCLLMTEFYKHWTNGYTKYEALKRARQTVRNHVDKKWNHPHYWASFILLDALESN